MTQPVVPEVAVVDDPDAPVIFVDELTGGGPGPHPGVFNFTFATVLYDYTTTSP
jgi:hypothetical protein